jgi:8-amino-7-oxononanoate synthase
VKTDATPVRAGASLGGSNRNKRTRRAFLEPFEPLLQQVEAARAVGIYPFYEALDPSSDRYRLRQPVIFVHNDYLGLSHDERVREAGRRAITRLGTSRCSSPLAGGHTDLHRDLERRLSTFLEQEASVVFASGYQANVGIVSALMRRGDLVLTDLFDHASIVDGARLSGAEVRFFQHNSPAHLEKILAQAADGRRVLVIVEGIYSADGDIAALPRICEIAHTHGALVMIDEAHSLGVLGHRGCGAAEHFGLLGEVDLIMGTMSKSLASVGGFVAGDRCLVDAISHSARSLIFSAALPPASVAAATTSLEILEAEPERRERLWRNARLLLDGLAERGLDTMGSETPVVPISVGDPDRTIELATRLRNRGVLLCPAIPPMVPGHRSRVRAHVTANHEPDRLLAAIPIIEEECDRLGVGRPAAGKASHKPAGDTEGTGAPAATENHRARARDAGRA